ncbi:hypothetical protein T492DRAFT_108510, partial [Pavlovales sp. CCMP2436]
RADAVSDTRVQLRTRTIDSGRGLRAPSRLAGMSTLAGNPAYGAVAALAEAAHKAALLRLGVAVTISVDRAVGDSKLSLSVLVPPAAVTKAAAPAHHLAAHPMPAPAVLKGTRRASFAAGTELAAESRPPLIRSSGSAGSYAEHTAHTGLSLGDFHSSGEVNLLIAELARLKRKALSRGVNLTSTAEQGTVPAEDVARLKALFSLADSNGSGEINQARALCCGMA